MKERPILMSAPMVRAILDGTKTQTRRIVKPVAPDDWLPKVGMYAPTLVDKRTGEQYPGPEVFGASDESFAVKCPYGIPGQDRLWVKETWATDWIYDDFKPTDLREGVPLLYRADEHATSIVPFEWGQWRPSLFMRRWMSRLTLEITEVRVERLQDISEADAVAEGCTPTLNLAGYNVLGGAGEIVFVVEDFAGGIPKAGDDWQGMKVEHVQHVPARQIGTARADYRHLWNRINGAGSWAANPWVWVVSFRRVEA